MARAKGFNGEKRKITRVPRERETRTHLKNVSPEGSKLSGDYLKILASTADEHREITAFLKEKGEEFHAIDPIEVRPQKVVIKGLPISTEINAIRDDLTERGFNVIKVAQLTKAKSKLKTPHLYGRAKEASGRP
ncbi:hypothetical protein TNCV_4390071 [Trichonephila clavipes]|nr:hypothetical protein TNCV_4390071 [Trichonephila clavipes]